MAIDVRLQRWVALRRSTAETLSGACSVVDGTVATPEERVGSVRDFLAELRASHAQTLASVRDSQRSLVARLQASGIDMPSALRPFAPPLDFATQFDDGFEGLIGPGYLRGVRSRDADELSVTGLAGVPLTREAVVVVAESVLTSVRQRPERPVLMVLDEGPPAANVDESRPLSEYLVHLARVLAWARSQAVAVNLWLCGGVTAASYVACAASASHVVAFPNAVLHLEGSEQDVRNDVATSGQWASVGLVDELVVAGRRAAIAWNASV